MNSEQQRIAIAKACGWTEFAGELHKCYAPNGVSCYWSDTPDYLNDLNAMHEAEKLLTHDKHIRFEQILSRICGDDFYERKTHWSRDAVSAKAAQRAEAFLRTLNLWKD